MVRVVLCVFLLFVDYSCCVDVAGVLGLYTQVKGIFGVSAG